MKTSLKCWGNNTYPLPRVAFKTAFAVTLVALFTAGYLSVGTAARSEDRNPSIEIGVLAKRGPEQCLKK